MPTRVLYMLGILPTELQPQLFCLFASALNPLGKQGNPETHSALTVKGTDSPGWEKEST